MKCSVFVLLAALIVQPGCSKKDAGSAVPAPEKRESVSIDGPADAPKAGEPAEAAAPAPPPPEAAPEAPPAANQGETLQGESELADWSYALQDYVYRTKHYPRDIAELATSVHKAIPRAPAGYKIAFDKENQRVVLMKGN